MCLPAQSGPMQVPPELQRGNRLSVRRLTRWTRQIGSIYVENKSVPNEINLHGALDQFCPGARRAVAHRRNGALACDRGSRMQIGAVVFCSVMRWGEGKALRRLSASAIRTSIPQSRSCLTAWRDMRAHSRQAKAPGPPNLGRSIGPAYRRTVRRCTGGAQSVVCGVQVRRKSSVRQVEVRAGLCCA